MTRHGLVKVFSLVTLLTVSFVPNASAELRVRKNYRDLTAAEREKFRDALVAMKAFSETDGLWDCLAPNEAVDANRICSKNSDCNTCTAPSESVGKFCNNSAECDSSQGAADGVCEPGSCPTDQTTAICSWKNKYDKYVCWHDKCG